MAWVWFVPQELMCWELVFCVEMLELSKRWDLVGSHWVSCECALKRDKGISCGILVSF